MAGFGFRAPSELFNEFFNWLNFLRSVCPMANSTMKSTISSVIMSAYVISQRSWLTCSSSSSCRFLRAAMGSRRLRLLERLAVLGGQVGQQLLLDDARVGAGLDRQDPLEQQLAVVH